MISFHIKSQIVFVMFTFFFGGICAQHEDPLFQDILETLKEETCICIETLENQGFDEVGDCIVNGIENRQNDFYEYALYKDSVSNGEWTIDKNQMQMDIMQGTFFELVWDCDSYYHFFVEMRETMLDDVRKEMTPNYMDSISNLIEEEESVKLLRSRGTAYFALEEYTLAEKDLKDCLELNSEDYLAYFFLGWMEEKKGNYDEAVEYYESIKNLQSEAFVLGVFAEVARRKKTEMR